MSDLMICLIAIAIYFAAITICGVITWLQMKRADAREVAAACRAFNAEAKRPAALILAQTSR